jgi:predicted metal-dependent peptidase
LSGKLTGRVIMSRADVPQKNGDIYIYEREYQYDPTIKKTKRISNRLIAKIPKGMNEEVSTRAKRKSTGASLAKSPCDAPDDSSIYSG